MTARDLVALTLRREVRSELQQEIAAHKAAHKARVAEAEKELRAELDDAIWNAQHHGGPVYPFTHPCGCVVRLVERMGGDIVKRDWTLCKKHEALEVEL